MNQYKLIACDLDGTLLLNGAQSLSPKTLGLIERLLDRGYLFIAASGRQYTNLRRLFAPLQDRIGYLCENGCLGYYQGERLFKEHLDYDLGQTLIKAIMDTKDAEVLLTGERVSYLQPKTESYFLHMRDVVKNDVIRVVDILNTPEDYMKISLYQEGGLKDIESWQRRFGHVSTVVTGGHAWLDMMPLHVNKATGLSKILSHLNIDKKEVIAIGDNDNDLEMLQLAGYPVAMNLGKPGVKAAARLIIKNCEPFFEDLLNGVELV